MFEQISKLIAALRNVRALENSEVVSALRAFSLCLPDPDYRSHLVGELGVSLASLGRFDQAEELARSIETTEKSEFLRQVADVEAHSSEANRALPLFLEAREAALLNPFATQQAQALSEIALSLEATPWRQEAIRTWNLAIDLAKRGQHREGTDGPEAAGVLLKAVEALSRAGKKDDARAVADEIVFEPLRKKAIQAISGE